MIADFGRRKKCGIAGIIGNKKCGIASFAGKGAEIRKAAAKRQPLIELFKQEVVAST